MSNNLNLDQVADTQDDKVTTINDQAGQIDAAMTETLDVDFTSGNVSLTADEFTDYFEYNATNLSVARTLTVQASKRFFLVNNENGTNVLTVERGSTTIAIAAGENGLFYTDGTTNGLIQAAGGGGSSAFTDLSDTPGSLGTAGQILQMNSGATALEFTDKEISIAGFTGGVPTGSAILLRFLADRAFSLPSGLADAEGHAGTTNTGALVFDLQKNGVSIGSMNFAASASTATFTFSTTTSFAAGDRFDVVAPATPGTIADVSYSFGGTR